MAGVFHSPPYQARVKRDPILSMKLTWKASMMHDGIDVCLCTAWNDVIAYHRTYIPHETESNTRRLCKHARSRSSVGRALDSV